ncbi:hypothetical protein I3843_06G048000 [Carya illinoinensis]|nr:hypothetical protein I3843_06G048000 [Carya illinoinensis]
MRKGCEASTSMQIHAASRRVTHAVILSHLRCKLDLSNNRFNGTIPMKSATCQCNSCSEIH